MTILGRWRLWDGLYISSAIFFTKIFFFLFSDKIIQNFIHKKTVDTRIKRNEHSGRKTGLCVYMFIEEKNNCSLICSYNKMLNNEQ